jgi:predicted RNA-binding protein associated with RNAse of E/G family
MITVVKLNPQGVRKIQYSGELSKRMSNGVVISALWTHLAKDLGYTRFEPGDHFTEYYYTDRWFNIFDIASADGQRKGWYCNMAQPATIAENRIEQIDLLLDVWVDPRGNPLVLDEDEFVSDTTLSEEQRAGARQGLQDILRMVAAQEEPFVFLSFPGKDKS